MIISVWKVLFMTIFFSTNDLVHRDQYLVYNCVYKLPPPPYSRNTLTTLCYFYDWPFLYSNVLVRLSSSF